MLTTLAIIIVTLLIAGFIWYLINQFAPIDARFKNAIGAFIMLFLLIWLISVLMGWTGLLGRIDLD